MKIAAIILAGGQARRMGGGDKALLPLGSGTLLSEILRRLKPQVDAIALNANGDPERFRHLGVPVVSDTIADFAGPLAGVLAGMDWAAQSGHSHVASVAGDTPFFPTDLIARLQTGLYESEAKIALATSMIEGRAVRHPTFGLWPVDLREDLRRSLKEGLRKVVLWTDLHGAASVVFEGGPLDPFFNVNTPEDLTLAQSFEGALQT